MASEMMVESKTNVEVYNDVDFYQSMLKDFLASNEGTNSGAGYQQDDDDIYTDGADLGMTMKFLDRKRRL